MTRSEADLLTRERGNVLSVLLPLLILWMYSPTIRAERDEIRAEQAELDYLEAKERVERSEALAEATYLRADLASREADR